MRLSETFLTGRGSVWLSLSVHDCSAMGALISRRRGDTGAPSGASSAPPPPPPLRFDLPVQQTKRVE